MTEEENLTIPFNIYPNPANEMVTFAFSTMEESTYNIMLIDLTGRVVKSQTGNATSGENTYIMNLDGIAKGLYLVELRIGDTFNKVKLIVQ